MVNLVTENVVVHCGFVDKLMFNYFSYHLESSYQLY